MSKSLEKLEVVAKYQIAKYAEGVTPETGQPFEVVEKEEVLRGQQAKNYLEKMGVDVNGIN